MTNNDIVQKLWNLCDVLRDDGINYSDYVTELVLLLFIKMVNESTESGSLKEHPLPEGCRWTDLNDKKGMVLLECYKTILSTLATGKRIEADPKGKDKFIEVQVHNDPLIMAIYADAQTRLREPRHLEQIIKRFDEIKGWFSDKSDGLGNLYEGLLDKNANETKSGAGQYFTPRALINSMVRCIKPQPGEVIQDPAAGTAGFLVTAHEYVKSITNNLEDLSPHQQYVQKNKAYFGVELVPNTRRLALMNCLLHGMEGEEEGVVRLGNALGEVGKEIPSSNIILANPPFGSSKGGDASISRDDLPYETTNKQLAFLQHIYLNLKPGGRAAVVLPDNVLFETGKGTDIRRDLMDKCNLHTILRLPKGIFYAQGVQTNVLFFQKGAITENIWVYDLRTNIPTFGKRTPFTEDYLKPFEKVFGDKPDGTSPRQEGEWSFGIVDLDDNEADNDENQEGNGDCINNSRWRCFSRDWIRDTKGNSLDISWLKDKNSVDVDSLPEPDVLARKAKKELEAALEQLDALLKALEGAE
ncbi:class I SAM-dependent DNA methyltransferase [Vibrio harveyi]|uniref:class I SAM-dependent DNA methyltransferase n=1 Tax=Vibrio harveyi TaxID=669 RepID=UPI0003A565AE|nr:N-6 DNA methylase [Vibrio harveyi]MBY7701268.1 N-6 DNA methylase [Vibrio harveyi]PNM53001.1 SAM-dependent methyltransferase [Vibrio harveyi]UIL57765.1 type I restriction-modification system subunit M [Vibrio harveyi]SQA27586.1 type I restriction enzyme EcoKI M subunit [Vibrio harveyi]